MKPNKKNKARPDTDLRSLESEAPDRRYLWTLAFVFGLALLLRLAYLFELKDAHIASTLMGDSELYDIWAREILRDGWIGHKVFFQAPFYPYLLAIVYALFGESLLAVRIMQIVLGSLSCVLIAEVGRMFFSRSVGKVSGLLAAVYPMAIFYDYLIQKETFSLFFTALILYLIAKAAAKRTWIWWALCGVTTGLLVMVRENAMILAPIVLFWLAVYFRKLPLKTVFRWGVIFIIGLTAVLFPVILRNTLVGGEFVLVTTNLGFNLYVGNSKEATGTWNSLVLGRGDWRYESSDAKRLAEKAVGKELSDAEVSGYWTGRALESIGEDVPRWMNLVFRKWLLLWNAVESSDTESIYAHMDYSGLLRTLGTFLNFGTLFPLAAFGVGLTWANRSRLWLLYLILIGYAAGIMPFFVFARYRQIMLPVLIPFASAGLILGFDCLRRKRLRSLAVPAAVAVLAAVFSNWPAVSKETVAATTYYNWGSVFENRNQFPEAERFYARAIQLYPNHVLALNNLGIVACRQGKFSEGILYFQRALKIDPRLAKSHSNLAVALYSAGRLDEALIHFQETLRLDPDYDPHVDYDIACILSLKNQIGPALDRLQRAVGKGYDKWENIKNDKDLENIRNTLQFKQILQSIPEKPIR